MATKYLNNKDMLKQIHLSKATYCEYITDEDRDHDIILPSIGKINIRTTAEGKRLRAKRLEKLTGEKHDPKKIQKHEVIFRIMTFDHIPNSNRKAKPKNIAESKIKCNFPPGGSNYIRFAPFFASKIRRVKLHFIRFAPFFASKMCPVIKFSPNLATRCPFKTKQVRSHLLSLAMGPPRCKVILTTNTDSNHVYNRIFHTA